MLKGKKARKSTTQRAEDTDALVGEELRLITYMQQNKLGRTSAAEGYENV